MSDKIHVCPKCGEVWSEEAVSECPRCSELAASTGSADDWEKLSEAAKMQKRIHSWKQEASDAVAGKYGPCPQGEGMDYWRGRKAVLFELAAFLPPNDQAQGRV